MRITIDIDTDNAAFDDDKLAEVVRILRVVVDRLGEGFTDGRARDLNGNTVCKWRATDATL